MEDEENLTKSTLEEPKERKISRRQPWPIASKVTESRENESGIQALTFCSEAVHTIDIGFFTRFTAQMYH